MNGRRAVQRTIPALILIFAAMGAARAADGPLPYTRQVNVVYGEINGTGLLADIFIPKEKPNGLGIIDVVSGAWHSDRGKLRDHEAGHIFDIFTKHGYVVFGMRPGSVTKYDGTEMLANVQTAIRWVKAHAGEYHVDPNRLGMIGASAGGHLALLASVTPLDANLDSKNELDHFDTRVKAVSVFFPPTDLTDWDGKKPDYSGEIGRLLFTGGVGAHTQAEIDAKAAAVSPLHYVAGAGKLPPYLIFHGDADPMVPLSQSQRFVDAVKAIGGYAELVIKPGGGHPWPTIHEEVAKMADWFDKQL